MWPCGANLSDPPADTGSSKDPLSLSDITTERVELIVSEARLLRSQTLADIIKRSWERLVCSLRSRTPPVFEPEKSGIELEPITEHDLKTSLTSIRAAAEIVRANVELSVDERNRFLDVVIEDNLRLERHLEKVLQELPSLRKTHGRQSPTAARTGFNTQTA
jgi:signal transduction histidine kinase